MYNACPKSRSILFLFTAFPCFFETITAILRLSDGAYSTVSDRENALVPLLNSRCMSVFFFILSYFIESACRGAGGAYRRLVFHGTVLCAAKKFF